MSQKSSKYQGDAYVYKHLAQFLDPFRAAGGPAALFLYPITVFLPDEYFNSLQIGDILEDNEHLPLLYSRSEKV